jgi:hypothetical protein
VAFFQPLVFFKPSLGPREREITVPLEGFGKMARDLRKRTVRELERAREEEGLELRDLSGLFDSIDDDLFYDFIHVTVRGKEILARAMAEDVVARIEPREARAVDSATPPGGGP